MLVQVLQDAEVIFGDTFSGWIQTRVNEKANKVWRDLGNRGNASGVASDMALWEKLTDADVRIQTYMRTCVYVMIT